MRNRQDIIAKLTAHERSARKIGNIAEADLYAAKIAEMNRVEPVRTIVKETLGMSIKEFIDKMKTEQELEYERAYERMMRHMGFCRTRAEALQSEQ